MEWSKNLSSHVSGHLQRFILRSLWCFIHVITELINKYINKIYIYICTHTHTYIYVYVYTVYICVCVYPYLNKLKGISHANFLPALLLTYRTELHFNHLAENSAFGILPLSKVRPVYSGYEVLNLCEGRKYICTYLYIPFSFTSLFSCPICHKVLSVPTFLKISVMKTDA